MRSRSSGTRYSSSLCSAQESKWTRKRSSVVSIRSSTGGTGSPSSRGQLLDVLAAVAVLGRRLAASQRFDRGAEELHLTAGVVVVVLALDLVPGEGE